MSGELVPAELAEARDRIDDIDREIVELLAARFELTHQVGILKVKEALEALDESRQAEKLSLLRKLCAELFVKPFEGTVGFPYKGEIGN